MFQAFETPELISSLSTYAYARRDQLEQPDIDKLLARRPRESGFSSTNSSLLFMQVYAAADYFSLNKTLMETVPPVLVDIILDPYLLNVFPQSLVPTAGYICIVAILAWFLSGWVYKFLLDIAKSGNNPPTADKLSKGSKKTL